MELCETVVVAEELSDDWSAGSVEVVFGVAFILASMFQA